MTTFVWVTVGDGSVTVRETVCVAVGWVSVRETVCVAAGAVTVTSRSVVLVCVCVLVRTTVSIRPLVITRFWTGPGSVTRCVTV